MNWSTPLSRAPGISGDGQVGFGVCLVLADAGHQVAWLDMNSEANATIKAGQKPFLERKEKDYLERALAPERLSMTDVSAMSSAQVITVVLGAPVDGNLNPHFRISRDFRKSLEPHLRRG